LAFLGRQAAAGIHEVIQDLIFAACRDKGLTHLPQTVGEDLDWLKDHALVEDVPMPDEITGGREVFWRITINGKDVLHGHAHRPAGLDL
jgi:hypothetical protein